MFAILCQLFAGPTVTFRDLLVVPITSLFMLGGFIFLSMTRNTVFS